ncbi:hypothetical protein GCM10010149_13070 [Nonomuraea roseoviolacea subsp. roseoviolacea]|uniref:Transglutaminase domain-containing protein n=1 Tax=Nonomuraea roseoviolacea subsp. carminata TaxID=160689 RepID=A0ABT1KC39_9ACTN|nr:hypothetical protein [Nonomuraea roseoviolacea]MCP2351252.1 hypothetical protein [Nonomuraea roseoviolacea subsp. carminata]
MNVHPEQDAGRAHDIARPEDMRLEDTVRALRLVPDDARGFDVPWADAERDYNLPPDVLRLMLAEGLGRPSGFDHFDLLNVSLDMGVRSLWTFGPASWAKGLRAPAGSVVRAEIEYVPECAHEPGEDEDCAFQVLLPGGWTPCPQGTAVARFELPVTWPGPEPRAAELLEEFGRVRFVRLPMTVGLDLDFIGRTGVADCTGGSLFLVREGRRRGLPIRLAQGVILSPPFSVLHYWAEIENDGLWVPHDPLIVGAMLRWGLLDPAEWDVRRSTGAVLARVSGEMGPMGLDAGRPAGVSFATTVRTVPIGSRG